MEWSFVPKIFHQLCAEFFTPEIDLFASRLNAQVDKYFSWFPDHHFQGTDSLSQSWQSFKVYAFPPFFLIPRVLHTECEDAILIFSFWPTKPWFPALSQMLITTPIILPPLDFSLYLPAIQARQNPSVVPQTSFSWSRLIEEHLQKKGISKETSYIISRRWKTSSIIQYESVLENGWFSVCGTKIISYRRLETGDLS